MEVPKVTCEDVNALAKMCSISREKDITTLKECSSSLFVLLYQRLFNCNISGIETSPYTVEQKRWNVSRVLNELQDKRGINVAGIDAEEVVHLNEEHISRLIRLFMDIAQRAGLQRGAKSTVGSTNATSSTLLQLQLQQQQQLSLHSSYNAAHLRPVLAEVPHDSADDGTWYAPVGTAEEWRSMHHPYYTRQMYSYLPPQGNVNVNGNINISGNVNVNAGVSGSNTGMANTNTNTNTTATTQTTTAIGAPSRHPSRLMAPLDPHHHPQQQQQHSSHPPTRADHVMMDEMQENTEQEDLAFPTHGDGEEDGGGVGVGVLHQMEMDGSSAGSYGNLEEEEIPTEQLVKAWSAEVIPPAEPPYMREAANIADVQRRLLCMQDKLDKAARRQRTRRPQQRSHSYGSSTGAHTHTITTSNTGGRGVNKSKNRNNNNTNNHNSSGVNYRHNTSKADLRLREEKNVDYSRGGDGKFPHGLLPGSVSLTVVRKQPKRMIDYTLRDEKIEMLRSLRFLDDLQKDIRRKLVERHSRETQRIREEIRYSLKQDQQELIERKRQIRDEDEKYRKAYATIVAAASNNLRTADALMRERTRQLSEYQAQTLRENRAMSRYLKRESKERMRHGLLHYASAVTGWQSHFVS
ncbi:hypothetical protein LSM04_008655 [Trypanosoma melophagium]|uniref:uncharacterized protein n=1 Tax=Trypanosoma melophagium TaxID=715481 RepID=UPI00351A6C19|nr:hypothetical protein LSM04_008655 [Trypanosoma melophagium]